MRDLIEFEEDMIDLIHKIRFHNVKGNFQSKLNKDLKAIKSSNITIMAAHETSNMYSITKDVYSHLLDNAVTATFKKTAKEIEDSINEKDTKYAK